MKVLRLPAALSIVALLAACGGGGGGADTTPVPTPTPTPTPNPTPTPTGPCGIQIVADATVESGKTAGASALSIKQNRMAHASEIVDQVGKAGLRYTEQPVHILYTDYSRKKGQSLLNSVNILTELLYK